MVQGSQTFIPSCWVGSQSGAGKFGPVLLRPAVREIRVPCMADVWPPPSWFGNSGVLGSCAKLGFLNCISWGGNCWALLLHCVEADSSSPASSAGTVLEKKGSPRSLPMGDSLDQPCQITYTPAGVQFHRERESDSEWRYSECETLRGYCLGPGESAQFPHVSWGGIILKKETL